MQAPKLATYEDLVARNEDDRAEIIDGVFVTPPPPIPGHGRGQGSIIHEIGGPFDYEDGRGGPGGWWILPEVDVALAAHDVVRPDIAGWRRERLPDPWHLRPVTIVPDWICEVISSSHAAHDRVTKRRLYARHGVAYYWLLHPIERTLEAWRLDPATKTWHEVGSYDDTAKARIAPFDAIEIEVAKFFPPLAPPGL